MSARSADKQELRHTEPGGAAQQQALEEFSRQVTRSERLRSVVTDHTVLAGSNVLPHRLGKRPRGFLVVDRSAGTTLFRTDWDARNITLTSIGPGDITLEVW